MSSLVLVSHLALWLLLMMNFLLVLTLYRHFGLMSLGTLEGVQRDGLAVGDRTVAIIGVKPNGLDGSWSPSPTRPSLLLFAAPDCEPCRAVFPDINELADTGDMDVAVVTDGPQEQAEALGKHITSNNITVLADDASGAFGNYRVRVTPFAFVIGEDGRVRAKGLCNDPLRIRELLDAAGLVAPMELTSHMTRSTRNGEKEEV
ncbi:MAG TPA: redoxin family protein [Gaiellaceae bacterium]|jgi:methylamine dehydrogenase accessory protein MauD|nr:redoxin family protein [Gaiellaceae bacterium]